MSASHTPASRWEPDRNVSTSTADESSSRRPDAPDLTAGCPLLCALTHPDQIAAFTQDQLERMAGEIRTALLAHISRTGGHLAPSLGVVELTLALLNVFNPARDKIVWDVGHQAYPYKLLTGRLDRFHTLRQMGGLCGFPSRDESPYDHFGTGHASTSISSALGMAIARDLAGQDHHVISVIGDGSLTGGLAYEGMNQAGAIGKRFIVILNDNEMSISKNVGALSLFMSSQLSSGWVRKVKREVENLLRGIPGFGYDLVDMARRSKLSFKNFFSPGMLFEALRFNYIGAVDGHDISALQSAFRLAAGQDRPVLIHVLTRKGKGYAPAENNPVHFHGIGRFEPATGGPAVLPLVRSGQQRPGETSPLRLHRPTYTEVFGQTLCALAEKDPRVVAITAAMPEGTGLKRFSERFPDRFFDVGIAEAHAVTFAAGLASQGLRPVVCIYSTFMQRAYDQIVHDVCLQRLPVLLCLDRAGIVGEDGATHQGAFDLAYLRHIPNLRLFAPKDEAELQRGLVTAFRQNGPFALRYPRGSGEGAALFDDALACPAIEPGKGEFLSKGSSGLAVLALGNRVGPAARAAKKVAEETGTTITVYNSRWVKPLPAEDLKEIAAGHDKLLVVEEGSLQGGFSSAVLEFLADHDLLAGLRVRRIGLPDAFVEHGAPDALRACLGIDASGIADGIKALMRG